MNFLKFWRFLIYRICSSHMCNRLISNRSCIICSIRHHLLVLFHSLSHFPTALLVFPGINLHIHCFCSNACLRVIFWRIPDQQNYLELLWGLNEELSWKVFEFNRGRFITIAWFHNMHPEPYWAGLESLCSSSQNSTPNSRLIKHLSLPYPYSNSSPQVHHSNQEMIT
jgi:hypothetical protein